MAKKEDNEKELQEKYMHYQMLEKQKEQISQNLEALSNQVSELNKVITNLRSLKEEKKGSKLIIPLANGIFARASLEDADNLIVNVGASSCVERSNEEVQNMLSKQLEDMQGIHQQLDSQLKRADVQSNMLAKEINKAMKENV